MSYNFLDKTGLTYFWGKIKDKLDNKQDKLTIQTAYSSKGTATKVPQITTNTLGQVTGITEVTITPPSNYMYSIEKSSGTIDDLAAFTSGKPGLTGSISLTKKSSGIGSEIPAGWYNYYFAPHRTGVGGDNISYGNIILTPMNFSGKSYILRRSSSTNTIAEVKTIITNSEFDTKTNTSVLPNNNGEIKTKYRISNKNYTGSGNPSWYYPLCKLPTDNNGNYASAIISGRIGGWVAANMSYINALAWNRSGTGISLFDIAGTAGSMSSIWGTCDIVIYTDAETVSTTQNDNGIDTVYLKCNGYFTFDLDLEMFQSSSEILYDGTHITTTPTGTLVAQASTSTKRAELINGKLYVAGKETGTITGIKMNGASKGTTGVVDLGTVITSHQDISGKQDKLTTQTAYTSKGSATKVPQITTNTLGQVTGITEVTISQPTVNNGTLTIQKNGTNVQTFSANQSGNATANITVPTKVSDLNNDSNFTSKTYVDNAVAANRGAENPIATILAYAGSEAPDGYLLCRGQAVSRTTYSLLFNAIGTQYGSGDGSTTFNIPDLQGKVIAGLDIVDEDFNVLGKTGGSKTVQLTKNQLPKINGSFTMHGAGSSTPVSNVSGDFTSDYNNTKYKNGGTEASGAGSKGNVKLVIGNDEAHENKQPYNTLNYIIKAYSGTDVPVPVESNSVKNSYDDSIANVYSTNYINTKVRGKKLWTNPNPNSNFAAQTITFDETNDYDFYKIKIKYGTEESYAYNWQDVEVGDIFNLLLMWSYTPGMADPSIKGHTATGFRPDCSCNHNSITFTNAIYYTSMDSTKSVNDTSHCIPLEIYGYYI